MRRRGSPTPPGATGWRAIMSRVASSHRQAGRGDRVAGRLGASQASATGRPQSRRSDRRRRGQRRHSAGRTTATARAGRARRLDRSNRRLGAAASARVIATRRAGGTTFIPPLRARTEPRRARRCDCSTTHWSIRGRTPGLRDTRRGQNFPTRPSGCRHLLRDPFSIARLARWNHRLLGRFLLVRRCSSRDLRRSSGDHRCHDGRGNGASSMGWLAGLWTRPFRRYQWLR